MPQKRTGAVRRRQPRNKKTLSAVISAVLVLAAVLVYYFPELETYLTGAPNTDSSTPAQPTQSIDAADCAVYFLDVGQGDSILIQIGTDYNMLIDAGTREAGETIESDLQALGVTSFDAVVATHPHADHIGSMKQIIEDYTIGTFYMPLLPDDQTPTTATYENMLDALLDKNVQTEQISTDTKISAPENANFAVLSPEKDEIFDNLNNYSAVLRFTYGNISFMLTGDAETEVEENILARETDITSNVLKCGHHGSSTSSSMDFLRAVNPAVAVISCGQDNKYGHPHHETLESLSERNCKILRTDTDGTVAVTTDGNMYSVYTWSAENGLSPAA